MKKMLSVLTIGLILGACSSPTSPTIDRHDPILTDTENAPTLDGTRIRVPRVIKTDSTTTIVFVGR